MPASLAKTGMADNFFEADNAQLIVDVGIFGNADSRNQTIDQISGHFLFWCENSSRNIYTNA